MVFTGIHLNAGMYSEESAYTSNDPLQISPSRSGVIKEGTSRLQPAALFCRAHVIPHKSGITYLARDRKAEVVRCAALPARVLTPSRTLCSVLDCSMRFS